MYAHGPIMDFYRPFIFRKHFSDNKTVMEQLCTTMIKRLFWSHAVLEFDYRLYRLAAV